jgi:uncharacterized membrane protein YkvA (DUF1232 family)
MIRHWIEADCYEQYSEVSFGRKLARYALRAGREVVQKALWLYYTAQEPGTPRWARRTIYGALGYFIVPLDAIPDVMPVIGYTDDLAVLATALMVVAMYVTPNAKRRAAQRMSKWFGELSTDA